LRNQGVARAQSTSGPASTRRRGGQSFADAFKWFRLAADRAGPLPVPRSTLRNTAFGLTESQAGRQNVPASVARRPRRLDALKRLGVESHGSIVSSVASSMCATAASGQGTNKCAVPVGRVLREGSARKKTLDAQDRVQKQ
jgi:hypothetical protein